jgi:hypothetical protein
MLLDERTGHGVRAVPSTGSDMNIDGLGAVEPSTGSNVGSDRRPRADAQWGAGRGRVADRFARVSNIGFDRRGASRLLRS